MSDDTYRELLIGCGHSRDRRHVPPGARERWQGLLTLDYNDRVNPDYIGDLEKTPWIVGHASARADVARVTRPHTGPKNGSVGGMEFIDDSFDEIHAYEVLEHLGRQGDFRAFFAQFSEAWRLLRDGGWLVGTCPSRYSGWLWGDPGHTRAILPESMVFLDQSEYIRQLDNPKPTAMSDYRNVYKADFRLVQQACNRDTFYFMLQAVKPSRWVEK